MCLIPEENQQPVLGVHRFFRRKVTIVIGRETKTQMYTTTPCPDMLVLSFLLLLSIG